MFLVPMLENRLYRFYIRYRIFIKKQIFRKLLTTRKMDFKIKLITMSYDIIILKTTVDQENLAVRKVK
jgi:hypothetical protein